MDRNLRKEGKRKRKGENESSKCVRVIVEN